MKTWLIFIYLAPTVITILLVQNKGVDGQEEESGIPFQNSSLAGAEGQELQQNSDSAINDKGSWSWSWSSLKRWLNFQVQNKGVDGQEEETGIPFQNSSLAGAEGQELQQNSDSAINDKGSWSWNWSGLKHWLNSKATTVASQQSTSPETIVLEFLNATEPSPGDATTAEPTIVPTTIPEMYSNPRCQPRSNPWASCSEATEEDKIQLAEALIEFAIKFYTAAVKLETSDSNLVFSPFSIAMMLSNLLLGARGETKTDLADLLSYPEEFTCIHDAMSTFRKSEVFMAASAIFTQPAVSWKEDFLKLSEKFYRSKLQNLTNDSDKDVNEINDWVRRNTDYKIKKLLDQLDSDVQMVLVNAVYFRSKWKTIFKTKHTTEENFYRPGLSPSKVLMMSSKKYPLASFTDHSLQAKVGRLQLSHNTSLVVIMPRSLAQNLSDVEKRLSGDVFKSMMTKLRHISFKPTVVTIPKFKVDSSLDLMSVVEEMAYGIFFDANLCGIAENEELAVSRAQHRAVMEINEEGVEAAAATAITLARVANFFEVQQPFIFAVVNEKNIPIFMGRINYPQA